MLQGIRHVALDMDGTIYNGSTLFPATNPFLETLAQLGIGHTFLTNNPSKSHADYLAHLRSFGLHANAENLYTSAQATIQFLQNMQPAPKRLFILGTPSMCAEFAAAGFQLLETPDPQHATRNTQHASPSVLKSQIPNLESPSRPSRRPFPTPHSDDPGGASVLASRSPIPHSALPTPHLDAPDAVVVGFDTTLTYPRLCRAAWWISRGKPFIATNPDRVCPTDQPTVLVDCGSICAMLQTATGRAPDAVMGKPDPAMLRGILERHKISPGQLLMIGDRLYTDMEMARRAGAIGALVLTGETTAQQAAASDIPDLVVRDLAELGAMLREARQ